MSSVLGLADAGTYVTHPLHQLRSVSPDTPVIEALRTMGREDVNQLPVMEAGRMEGWLSRARAHLSSG